VTVPPGRLRGQDGAAQQECADADALARQEVCEDKASVTDAIISLDFALAIQADPHARARGKSSSATPNG
jgi:hypothetical protein